MEIRRESLQAPAGPLELVTLFAVQPFENNVYVLVDPPSRQCVIVDASEATPTVEAVRGQGLDVQAILITHGHRDHHADLPALHQQVPAPVLVGEADADMLPIPADRLVHDGETVAVGPHQLQAVWTPGHTPGGTCWLVGDLLFSGDTLFPGGPGNTNPQTNRYGNFEQIMASLRSRLFTLPDQTRVLPGHGEPTTIGTERPHLDEWQARGW